MLSIFLLSILVLIQIMLVSTIFNNVKFSKKDPNYRKKVIVRDLFELGFLAVVIYLLSLNYLEFTGMDVSNANFWSISIVIIVIIGHLILNIKNFKSITSNVVETIKDDLEDIDIDIDKLVQKDNNKKVEKKTEKKITKKEDIKKYLAGNYDNSASIDNRYKLSNKYPFYLNDIGKPQRHQADLVSLSDPEFDNDNGEQEKLKVVFLQDLKF